MKLIPFTAGHYEAVASWLPDQRAVVQWGGSHVHHPLDAAQFDIMLAEGQGARPARHSWMAEAEGRLVGHGQVAFEWQDGNARLGRILVAPQERGRGWAKPMLRALIDHAFDQTGIERVELNVYTFNTGAIEIYKALGFAWEGARRSSTPCGDERWDTGMMGLLRTEWRAA